MKRRTFLAGLTLLAAGAAVGAPLANTLPAYAGPFPNLGPNLHIEMAWREGATAFIRVRFQTHTFRLKSTDGQRWRTA